jgi:hypothetical protein
MATNIYSNINSIAIITIHNKCGSFY